MWRTKQRVVIAGAGIGGLSAALGLQAHGHEVVVLERGARAASPGAALSLWPNAVRGLDALGVGDAARARAAAVRRSMLCTADGAVLSEIDVAGLARRAGAPMLVSHRADLHDVLLSALEPGTVRYGARLTGHRAAASGVELRLDDGSTLNADALVGADGVDSSVRGQLSADHAATEHDLVAVRAVVQSDAVEPGLAFEAWGDGMLFGAAAMTAGRVYWFYAARRDEVDAAAARIATWASPALELLAATPAEARLSHLVRTIPPLRRWTAGRVALLGDAAHAMTPNLGQGAAQAIEDAVALADAVTAHPTTCRARSMPTPDADAGAPSPSSERPPAWHGWPPCAAGRHAPATWRSA